MVVRHKGTASNTRDDNARPFEFPERPHDRWPADSQLIGETDNRWNPIAADKPPLLHGTGDTIKDLFVDRNRGLFFQF